MRGLSAVRFISSTPRSQMLSGSNHQLWMDNIFSYAEKTIHEIKKKIITKIMSHAFLHKTKHFLGKK